MPGLPGLLQPEPLTPQQATVYPRLCQILLDNYRQVWVNLLSGHCSFLLVRVCTWTQEKGAVTPQETGPDLP